MKKLLISLLIFHLPSLSLAVTYKIEHWQTKNGVSVRFYQAMEVPMLDLSLAFRAGSACDGPHYGLSALTAHMLNQGAKGQTATELAELFADLGTQFGAETSKDMVVFSMRCLSKQENLEQSTKLFSQIINHPDFPDEALVREKKQLMMAVLNAEESPEQIANLHFFQTLYKNHPYAHAVNGTLESINALTKSEVLEFYKQHYLANEAILVLVGAIDSPMAHRIAEEVSNKLPQGSNLVRLPKVEASQAIQKNIPFPSKQTLIRLGEIGIAHDDPNFFPLMVGNYIFGGNSMESRLSLEVREKKGLSYGIDSQFMPLLGEGPFVISLATKHRDALKALKITRKTLERFVHEGPSQEELTAAKQYLVGSFPLSLASNQNIAALLLRMAFYHLPDDFLETYVDRINAVSREAIKQAFQEQVDLNKLVLITVGQA